MVGAAVIFLFMMSGLDMVMGIFQGWAPPLIVDVVRSFSFLVHYDAIVRGVIDIRDLIYYLAVMGVFLFANVVVVDLKKEPDRTMAGGIKNWDRRTLGIAGLAMAAVFLVSLLVFSTEALRNATVDLTEAKVFTLSDGTKEVLSDIREPVTLRMFVSEELMEQSPALKDYARSVQELLERYAELSNGRIKLEIIHPEPFSPEEDRAVGFGLHGVPITQAGNLGYFGLAGTNTTDDLDTIAFFTPQRESFLEYDLSRLVQNLANPKKKKVGVVTSLPMDADPLKRYRPWQIIEQLRQFFDVQKITLEDPVPEDIDVLMVVHPRDMDDTDRYYIDQHIMRGGKAIIYVDPYSEEATRGNAMQRQPPDDGSDLKKLFEAYGIVYDKNKVLGDRKGAQRVSAGRDALGRPVITDYLAWVTLDGQSGQWRRCRDKRP